MAWSHDSGDSMDTIKLEELGQGLYRADLDESGRIGIDVINKFITAHKTHCTQYELRRRYYIGANPEILAHTKPADHAGPWNQVPVPIAKTLIDVATGFLYKDGLIRYELSDVEQAGKKGIPGLLAAIKKVFARDTKAARDEYFHRIMDIFKANEESSLNADLGHDQGLYGRAYELHYVSDAPDAPETEFALVDPREIFPIFSMSIKKTMVAAVRLVRNDDETKPYSVYVYYADVIREYSSFPITDAFTEQPHPFREVPCIEILNNRYGMSDIDPVHRLINAYDKVLSNAIDDEEKFADAVLLVYGRKLDAAARDNLKRFRVIDDLRSEADRKEDIRYLTKPDAGAGRQQLLEIIKKEIHKASMIPDLSDPSMLGQRSGEAMIYLFALFELLAGVKQSNFERAIRKRIRLITNALSFPKDSPVGEPNWINSVWTRNLPKNVVQIAQVVQMLDGIVSKETLLAQVPFVQDPRKELQRLQEEQGMLMTNPEVPEEEEEEEGEDGEAKEIPPSANTKEPEPKSKP